MGCTDFRYRWLSETISNVLGIFDTKYSDALFDEHGECIKSFFDDEINEFSHINRQILFLWRTFYDKMVEETITVLEEGKRFAIHIANKYALHYSASQYQELCVCVCVLPAITVCIKFSSNCMLVRCILL